MLIELLLLAAADPPKVVATFHHTNAGREGLIAEQIERPPSSTPDIFAEALVEAEGLTSWSAMDVTRSQPDRPLQWRAQHAGNGKEVIVYFASAQSLVCRIKRDRGGASEAHWQAIRWCAAALGAPLPDKRVPPIIESRSVPRS